MSEEVHDRRLPGKKLAYGGAMLVFIRKKIKIQRPIFAIHY
jgi:hypothetical protein